MLANICAHRVWLHAVCLKHRDRRHIRYGSGCLPEESTTKQTYTMERPSGVCDVPAVSLLILQQASVANIYH